MMYYIPLIIFLYLWMKLLRGVWRLKNFQKNFSFYASSSMTHFSLGAKSEKGIWKENSVAMIKRNIHCFLKAVCVEGAWCG